MEQVVSAAEGTPGYVLVKRGTVFTKDIHIPLDAILRRVEGRVYINVPKLVVGKLPWGDPPSDAAARDKLGAPLAQVGRLYGSFSPTGPVPDTSQRANANE